MCICVNCKFYSTCWINQALLNFPKNYKNLITNIRTFKRDDLLKTLNLYVPLVLEIQLNINSKNSIREPDIIFCDSFIEKPGNWLI